MSCSHCVFCSRSALGKFAKEQGIVLKLASVGDAEDDSNDIPRYVPMQNLSSFPEESEYLFSGNQNKFKVVDIYDCSTQKWNTLELSAIGHLQQFVQNGKLKWTTKQIWSIKEYLQLSAPENGYAVCTVLLNLNLFLFFFSVLSHVVNILPNVQ